MELLRRLGCGVGLGLIMLVLVARLNPETWAEWRSMDLRHALRDSLAITRDQVAGAAYPTTTSTTPADPASRSPNSSGFPVVPGAVLGGFLVGFCAPGRRPQVLVTVPRRD
jgi:hypothetical protein